MSGTRPAAGVAIVTGAANGIGRAIALRLARDGFCLAVNDLLSSQSGLDTLVAELSALHVQSIAVPGDVTVEADVQALVQAAVSRLGSVDVMVANAGIGQGRMIDDMTVEEWDRIFSINARGVFLCYKYAARQMMEQGRGGRIIGACSIAGKRGAMHGGAYCGTKFAVRGLTQTAAIEYGQHGITVNAYAPGFIDTELLRQYDEDITAKSGAEKGSWMQARANTAALKRIGTPEDVAGLVSFLASEDSRFITGQSIIVDGGTTFD